MLNVNRETGKLTKYASFYAGPPWRNAGDTKSVYAGYSADFSPGGRYIYTSTIYPGRIRRFDISNPDREAIQRSERFIANSGCSNYAGIYVRGTQCRVDTYTLRDGAGDGGGQILRGPNGKMYIADHGTPWISAINNPDAPTPSGTNQGDNIASAVDWQYGMHGRGITLPSGALSYYGLPQMVTLYSPRLIQY